MGEVKQQKANAELLIPLQSDTVTATPNSPWTTKGAGMRRKRVCRFALHATGDTVHVLELKGREEWALSHLLAAGNAGCTPIDTPGPRWADYVFKLRRRGINVETITEAHDGPYAGTHARYVLRSRVERLSSDTEPLTA